MNTTLLAMAIGPVQDFIAQARRSRDLWFGSHVLSELARAAAREALAAGAETLVFPALDAGAPDLEPCDAPLRQDGKPPLNIGNVLLLVVPTADVSAIAKRMRDAAFSRWQSFAGRVRDAHDVRPILADGIDDVWNEQIGSLLEVFAASSPIDEATPYAMARKHVMEALGARKNLRDFTPWIHDRAGAPKSSFDGGRVSVLAKPSDATKARKRFRLLDGEQLDAVGVVKRCGGEPEQFVPLANVALAGWLARCRKKCPDVLGELVAACKEHGVSRVNRPDLQWLAWQGPLAFDAELVLPDRLEKTLADFGVDAPDVVRRFTSILDRLTKTEAAGTPPVPHVCCLVADGDRMGAALGELDDLARHRDISTRLAAFAGWARTIVNAHGFTIYAGGDDVLGFVSPSHSLEVAEKLHEAFDDAMAGIEGLQSTPTLSVGLGIGHIFDGMAHLLDLGRQAERLAKGDGQTAPAESRNALGIMVDRRSGGTSTFRSQWPAEPTESLRKLSGLLGAALPMGKVHEVKRMIRRLPAPAALGPADREPFAKVLEGEVRRILARAGTGDGADDGRGGTKLSPERVALDVTGSYADCHKTVDAWVAKCLVAREFRGGGDDRREDAHG